MRVTSSVWFSCRAALWVRSSAPCLRWGAVCAEFARRNKKRANLPRLNSFPHVFSDIEMTKPSSPKAAVRRCCCTSTMFLHGSYTGCAAEDHGSEDPVCSQTDPRTWSPLLRRSHTRAYVRKMGLLHVNLKNFAGPPVILLSILHASGLATHSWRNDFENRVHVPTVLISKKKQPPLWAREIS